MNKKTRVLGGVRGMAWLAAVACLAGCGDDAEIPPSPLAPGELRFINTYVNTAVQRTYDAASNSAGFVAAVGSFEGTFRIAGLSVESIDGDDAFVAIFLPDGSPHRLIAFGGPGAQVATAVAIDDEGYVVVAGHHQGAITIGDAVFQPANGASNLFVSMLDPMGDNIWSKTYGSDQIDVMARDVALTSDRSVVMAGDYNGSGLDFGQGALSHAGGVDAFTLMLDPMGDNIWSQTAWSSPGFDSARGIAVAGDQVAVSGFWNSTNVATTTSDVLIEGRGVVKQYDLAGQAVGSGFLSNWTGASADHVAYGADGALVVAMHYARRDAASLPSGQEMSFVQEQPFSLPPESYGVIIATFDSEFAYQSHNTFGFESNDAWGPVVAGVAVASDGSITFGVEFSGSAPGFGQAALGYQGGQDVVIAKLDNLLAPEWAHAFGGEGNDRLGGVGLDAAGNVYTAGGLEGSVAIGGANVVTQGLDVFVASYAP
jgi:hypothetical protein